MTALALARERRGRGPSGGLRRPAACGACVHSDKRE